MKNADIAAAFRELGNLMELHGENKFKVRSYQNAYLTLRKWSQPLAEMSAEERRAIPGVGAAIADKIEQLLASGTIDTLERLREKTPAGIRDMLGIKGLGPKKIEVLWKTLGVESAGELMYACTENRLVELPGFGLKTQADVLAKLEFFLAHRDRFLYATIEDDAGRILAELQRSCPALRVELTGALRRRDPVIEAVELLVEGSPGEQSWPEALIWTDRADDRWTGQWEERFPVVLYWQGKRTWGAAQLRTTGDADFLEALTQKVSDWSGVTEEDLFSSGKLPYIAPERRHGQVRWEDIDLIEESDIKGVVHAHSTWSDGINSLAEMAESSRKKGYEYLVITDHSKAAFYANGLTEERVKAQWEEIDMWNAQNPGFRIFKGIECDILYDGALDYDDGLLDGFEMIIASVHSNLKMDQDRAMLRLLKAVENPATTMLGHPTGRLLLSREGYPVDHEKLLDACAANGVGVEINANPLRLDLDWTWVRYALDKGVTISINPDAHSTKGIGDIRYGVLAARKAGMTAAECLNTRPVSEFSAFLAKKQ